MPLAPICIILPRNGCKVVDCKGSSDAVKIIEASHFNESRDTIGRSLPVAIELLVDAVTPSTAGTFWEASGSHGLMAA